jgi:hypothetical protein
MSDQETVLDQVIRLDKQDKTETDISAVAEVIKKRDELKAEIEAKIAEDSSAPDTEEDDSDEANDDGEDDKSDDGLGDLDNLDDLTDDKEESKDKGDEDKSKDKEDSSTDKDPEDDKEIEQAATEAITLIRKISQEDFFQTVKDTHSEYSKYVAKYTDLSKGKHYSLEEQPIVYTKDKVLESLNRVVTSTNIYNKTIQEIVATMIGTLKTYVKNTTYYDEYKNANKTSFTSKLVTDKNILAALAVTTDVDVKASIRALYSYNTNVATLTKAILSNPLNTLPGSFKLADFHHTDGSTEYQYKDTLPGFNIIRSNCLDYANYLKTKVDYYNVYCLNTAKTFDFYSTTPVGLDKDTDLDLIIDYVYKLITSLAVITDNLKDLGGVARSTLDKLKVKIYDVENNKVQDLSTLGLDEALQDIIRLKLAIEVSLVTVKLNNKFLVNLFSFLKHTVALK